ncbi:MAG: PHP domain-containing protein [Woeseiaceae bacterium]
MIYDLHSHSNASDGALAPAHLLCHAADCGVDVLAITDHDTLDAYKSLHEHLPDVRLVTGIELSTSWNRIGVHIVGLNIDPANAILQDGVARQKRTRLERACTIAERLRRCGIPDCFDAVVGIAGSGYIGRPHFAQHLVAEGIVKDTKTAFRKYLGAGKPGDVRHGWAALDEVVHWIKAAGGTAVLAHPAKYGLTKTRTRALAKDFRQCGGRAIEVVCGRQQDSVTTYLAELANELDLDASCGSDFHDPGFTWSRPGGFEPLPAGVRPVWEAWQTSSQ